MPNEEKQRQKAKVHIAKAENLMEREKYSKAAEEFQKAAEMLFEIREWAVAEQCFFYASKNLTQIGKMLGAGNLQRLAANCCLMLENYSKARDYYDISAKSYLKCDAKNKNDLAAISVAFAFLCLFLMGQQDNALEYVKRFKSELDPDVFGSNLLIKLARNLSNAIYNESEKYLDEILADYPHFKFRASESNLIRHAVLIAMLAVHMKFKLDDNTTEFIMDRLVSVNGLVNCDRIKEMETNSIIPHKFKSIIIKDIAIDVGDNLSVKERPQFPISVDLSNFSLIKLPVVYRTNFPGKGYIGPVMITIEMDGKFNFFLKTKRLPINIASPQAILGVEYIALKTPVINQTFPIQVILSNKSDGEAVEIEIELEFPESLRMIRGTFKKTIYSLRPNEQFKFELQVKASEAGQIPVKNTIKFKDPDGNLKEPIIIELPIEINL
jgi:tetratricopeptide (TPR) repeat protein